MQAVPTPFPLEVLVVGTPMSLQASATSRRLWGDKVRAAATARRDQTCEMYFLDHRALAVTIYYFSDAPMAGDIDNIIKPILDGLIGAAYLDDRVVERVVAQKFEPDADWTFDEPSPQLALALDGVPPLVYIRIEDGLTWRAQNGRV